MWKAYSLQLRLESPLHIGLRKIGNVQMTRGYVPGWVLWGAFTARLCRDLGSQEYGAVGKRVREELAFSHFFLDRLGAGQRLLPWGPTAPEFAYQHLHGVTNTALRNGSTKEDGSLHETECLLPVSRDGKAVVLCGHIFERKGCELNWRSAAERLSLGGERSYGWGKVSLVAPPEGSLSPAGEWDLDRARPFRRLAPEEAVGGHLRRWLGDDSVMSCRDEGEVIVRRMTDPEKGQFGKKISEPEFCWAPSATFVKKGEVLGIELNEAGFWEHEGPIR